MAPRTVPRTAQKAAGQLIAGALWNAGPKALGDYMLAPPVFRGRQATAQSPISGSWIGLTLDVTDVDTDSGHSNTVNNYQYVCQVPGWYYVEGYFALTTGANACRFECSIAKNGTIIPGSAQFLLRQNDLQSLMAGALVQMAVGDYVTVLGRQNSGATLNTFVGTDLCCCMNVFWVHN